ncbi:biopolymer transporter ExbD [Algibacter amylolyticus]|uniref:Biopolymer transporter ExbD n=1 Tax=Algibacter amylolyticus TaxID=1608400 RepID=A0A5M7AVU9_9FLAO|nr:biopolymer transporter ExbD [Algibacter amylolyticus]KAA5821442.1 biopolymer transporter ExbD [Algibacter amylolyticus]MBB5268317.1 biopolymer transport protein ExbD [Algibacter amylolyticus]TSJ72954.1 biopolymer transporter ExbD [Algibacter amylolyticus]
MRHSKLVPEVNAGSMADIAFLLLIFFLVTATISSDEGINRVLPKDCPTNDCGGIIAERNILRIAINSTDDILIEDELVTLSEIKEIVKNFADNNGDASCNYCHGNKASTASDNPNKAVISLQNSKQTTYKTFVAVQNELTKAYYELRQGYSLNVLGKPAVNLTTAEENQVKKAYPFIISEAETK